MTVSFVWAYTSSLKWLPSAPMHASTLREKLWIVRSKVVLSTWLTISYEVFSSWIEEGCARNSFFCQFPREENPMVIRLVTEEAMGSSIGERSVFQQTVPEPLNRGVRRPSPYPFNPIGTNHPVNIVFGNHFSQHSDMGLTGNRAGLFSFGIHKQIAP